jgi:two-component system NtrC family response regulator
MANVLIIDDDKEMCKMLADMVTSMENNATYAHSIKDGLNEASSKKFDIVFLDVKLPDGNGLELLPTIRETESSPEVIIITGAGDPDGAEIAITNGAWDYMQKPLSPKKIMLPLTRVLQYRDDLKKAKKPAMALKLDGMVGSSPQWKNCLDLLAQIANSDANVLISGETGTGKELFARAIHNNGSRAEKKWWWSIALHFPSTLSRVCSLVTKRGPILEQTKNVLVLLRRHMEVHFFWMKWGNSPFRFRGPFCVFSKSTDSCL